ncbi:nucleoside triphosphate pyrophosphohydrolase family protein [Mycolicibacterium fortuitum]|uniref:NTP pyrophosphohydrolase MazG putative catalytic core domain-containing protein n=1 Tax=Mycolicibacterium fortuitum TaxID=1766 RepID=A0AAE5ADH9_MYCFO|nr:hypothetical protein [Mycolicibacterium fortuitum]MDV7193320.1 hypothetical protein [Mycolicibacterium fortuitum]MDV7205999.1 hypothetical protein [Mycolicibacterium fortuitum]MDV7227412.1 hypothetical protein [Mycolicibacterium fortuitum]MDV7259891.1 hypothetical protein [Mycolicibacterium fortuitum]MDV7286040.1 hypothetical protein [Mycolicibacterium fortuitum]
MSIQPTPAHHAYQSGRDAAAGNLDALAIDVGTHLDRLGVDRRDWVRVGKVAEEGGEVMGALIKRTQGRATTADLEDELGDVILAALGAIDQLGLQPSELVARRWAEVSKRTPSSLTKTVAAQHEQNLGTDLGHTSNAKRWTVLTNED